MSNAETQNTYNPYAPSLDVIWQYIKSAKDDLENGDVSDAHWKLNTIENIIKLHGFREDERNR